MNHLTKKLLSALLVLTMIFSLAPMLGIQAEGTWIGDDDLTDQETTAPTPDDVLPDANQYQYQKEELAAFVHFGPNTFNEVEWGESYGSRTPDEIFTLETDFDEEKLVKAIYDAGFKKVIVTAKHHDGFCIWDSAYTDYDVAATSYRDANGQSDILAEISAASCPRTYHVEGADELRAEWFDGAGVIGITAGASTPASQIEAVRARIGELVGE